MSGESRRSADYGTLRRLYAWYAADYDRRFARYSEGTLAHAVEALGDAPPGRLVDVACGTGLLVERIRRRWPRTPAIGIDLSEEMLAVAVGRLPRSEGDGGAPFTDWRAAPAERLPLDDGEADTLTCTNAFHLVQDPAAALAEFHRVLASGGRLVLVDWCRDFLSMRILLWTLRIVRRQRRIAWSLEDLSTAVRRAGFTVEFTDRFRLGPVWGLLRIVGRKR